MFEVCGQLFFAYLATRSKEGSRFRSEETDDREFIVRNQLILKEGVLLPTIWEEFFPLSLFHSLCEAKQRRWTGFPRSTDSPEFDVPEDST
jgi:hypothetical protein